MDTKAHCKETMGQDEHKQDLHVTCIWGQLTKPRFSGTIGTFKGLDYDQYLDSQWGSINVFIGTIQTTENYPVHRSVARLLRIPGVYQYQGLTQTRQHYLLDFKTAVASAEQLYGYGKSSESDISRYQQKILSGQNTDRSAMI